MRKKILPTTSACIMAAFICSAILGIGMYGLWTTILPILVKMKAPFWEAVIFCLLFMLLAAVATFLYEKISRRYTELHNKTSDK